MYVHNYISFFVENVLIIPCLYAYSFRLCYKCYRCKRFCAAVAHPLVLANASLSALAVSANKWCDGSHRFLRQCALSGNAEASYTLGMVRTRKKKDRCIGNYRS